MSACVSDVMSLRICAGFACVSVCVCMGGCDHKPCVEMAETA